MPRLFPHELSLMGSPGMPSQYPKYQLTYGPGESGHWWGAGGYSGVSNSRGQSQIHPSAPQDAWAVALRSRGPRAACRPAPPTDAHQNAASTTVCQGHQSPELPAQIAPAVRPGPLHTARPSPAPLEPPQPSHSTVTSPTPWNGHFRPATLPHSPDT